MKITVSPVWVCVDCYFLTANGEISPDCQNPQDLLSRLGEVTIGIARGAHLDGCPNRGEEMTEYVECECDQLGFSWSPCEGCGSTLGGSRYALTEWVDAA